MKHAFLIIAHNNWWQLKKLIECLDSDNHDIYVHVDKKSKDFDELYFANATAKSTLKFYREYEVFWGGFSQVQVELFLLQEATNNQYDYYHIISGVDLPLKNNADIDSFFEIHNGMEFIQYDDKALIDNPEISRRAKYYHFLQNYRRRYKQKWKNEFFTFVERVLLIIQIVLHVNRLRDLDWKIMYGSNWVSITDKLAKTILSNKEKLTKIFNFTNCADELIVQTVAYNCGFKEKIYKPEAGQQANLRYIDWSRGKNGNPYTFKKSDESILLPMICGGKKQCENLFARKFSESVDKEIICCVLNNLKNNKGDSN